MVVVVDVVVVDATGVDGMAFVVEVTDVVLVVEVVVCFVVVVIISAVVVSKFSGNSVVVRLSSSTITHRRSSTMTCSSSTIRLTVSVIEEISESRLELCPMSVTFSGVTVVVIGFVNILGIVKSSIFVVSYSG